MTSGAVIVGGDDLYDKFGCFVVQGGYTDLVTMPPTKAVVCNEWAEYAGAEIDAETIVLDKREVTVQFAGTSEGRLHDLILLLSTNGAIAWNFVEIGRQYTLRYTGVSAMQASMGLMLFSIKFVWNNPEEQYTGGEEAQTIKMPPGKWKIDGTVLDVYNAFVIGEITPAVLTAPVMQENFEQDCTLMTGVRLGGMLSESTRDLKMRLLMRAESLSRLWMNYDALLHKLAEKQAHTLTRISDGQNFTFFYKTCTVNSFFASGKIWLDFTLKLCNYENF